jgi:signal transduction histidine kinase
MRAGLTFLKAPLWQLVALTTLGIAGNFLSMPLFFGVEYLFGSIAVLIATALFGPVPGLFVAFLPAVQTILLWHHPYAAIPLLLEAPFVGLAIRRFRANLALAAMLYWILGGLPLVFFLYRYGLRMEQPDAVLAALKQSTNGVANAVVASLLVTYVPQLRAYQIGRDPRLTLFETIFNAFLAAALIPVFLILTFDARRVVGEVERDAQANLNALTSRIAITVSRWREDHVRAISMVANFMEQHRKFDAPMVQQVLVAHRRAWPNFYGSFVCDEKGVTIAFEPPVNARGESTIGISFADRAYFQKMRAGSTEPDVSPVFLARGGVFVPVTNITAPILRDGKFSGIVSGSINLEDLRQILSNVSTRLRYEATIVDSFGRVVASTGDSKKPLDSFPDFAKVQGAPGGNFSYHRWPDQPMPPMTRWKKSFLGLAMPIPGIGGWFLVVESPLRQQQDQLYARYGRVLTLFLVLAFALLVTSSWVAGTIARPLIQLSAETSSLPVQLEDTRPIRWPGSRLLEVNLLVQNFRMAFDALKRRLEELERSRAQLDLANRTKDEFLSIASHELKTPLTPLKMQVQMARNLLRREDGQAIDSERARRSFAIAEQQINRLTHLIDDLLDVSRITAGKLKLNLESFDLAGALREVAEQYRPQLTAAGCPLEVEAPAALTLRADRLRVEQVIVNLLTNAAKYAPRAKVRLSLAEAGGWAELRVSDEGPGIPPEAQEKIFDRFERVHTKLHVTGLGLGLFISRQIIEAHGGRITVSSELGTGSTFTVSLPLSV